MRLYFAGKEKICTFAVEFIPHSREGNRKTQALMLCVFCFIICWGVFYADICSAPLPSAHQCHICMFECYEALPLRSIAYYLPYVALCDNESSANVVSGLCQIRDDEFLC